MPHVAGVEVLIGSEGKPNAGFVPLQKATLLLTEMVDQKAFTGELAGAELASEAFA